MLSPSTSSQLLFHSALSSKEISYFVNEHIINPWDRAAHAGGTHLQTVIRDAFFMCMDSTSLLPVFKPTLYTALFLPMTALLIILWRYLNCWALQRESRRCGGINSLTSRPVGLPHQCDGVTMGAEGEPTSRAVQWFPGVYLSGSIVLYLRNKSEVSVFDLIAFVCLPWFWL